MDADHSHSRSTRHHVNRHAHTRALWVFAMLCISFSTLPEAGAWESLGATWPNLPVPYEVNGGSSQELGSQTSVNAVQASYNAWVNPSCSGFRTQYRGTTSSNWRSGDGTNTHQWIYNANQRPAELRGRETIGVTLSLYRGQSLVDGDILYNGIDHSWSTNPSRFGQVDAQSIITHEIGHQLGLGHTSVNGSTMYPSYAGGTGARTLAQDDIEGVCSLYPSGNNVECTRTADCDQGLECVQGQCVQVSSGEGQIGDRCENEPCAQGLVCVQGQDNGAFCTRICDDGQCPSGWTCLGVNSSQGQVNLCLPAQDVGDAMFGDPCANGQECSSGLCVSDGQSSFCSQSCTQDADCPGDATCAGLTNGGGACVPGDNSGGAGGFGDNCNESADCASGLCLDDGDNVYCTEECQSNDDCPQGAGCFDAGQVNVCAWLDEPGGGMNDADASYGEPCDGPADCIEELCLSDGMTQFCSRYCSVASDCPDGDSCVGIGDGQGGCLPGSGERGSTNGETAGSEAGDAAGAGVEMTGSGTPGAEMSMAGTRSGGDTSSESPSTELEGGNAGEGEGVSRTTLSASCRAQGGSSGAPFLMILLVVMTRHRRREGTS